MRVNVNTACAGYATKKATDKGLELAIRKRNLT